MATVSASPPFSVTPAGSPTNAAARIAEEVRDAAAGDAPIRILGAGRWLGAGAPAQSARTISVAPFTGITEYVPGDLVLTALAGTSLREIAEATAKNGQWLPLDPFGSADGTLGATVATASAGPLAHANGGPRDLVLGVECVTGAGAVIRGGGRVTKNVAGFDLTRLLVGSWGTLGVITEISVRLRARPAVDTTIAMPMPLEPAALGERVRWVRSAPLEALAIELLDARLAAALGFPSAPLLLVRLGGNADSVAFQRATLARAGSGEEVGSGVWESLRAVERGSPWVWRMSDLPSRIAETWSHAQTIVENAGTAWLHASVGRGIVRCICAPDAADDLARALASRTFPGTVAFESLPADRWPALSPGVARDPVSRRIRAAFDPRSLLNRGILGADVA